MMQKSVTTETRSKSETKIWHWRNSTLLKAKSYDQLKAEMKAIQQQMVEANKNERASALKKVKRLCTEFGFTAC